jgi:CCR4-NOT transcription complex subunit 3
LYFQQGTLLQMLAARELKRSNWRFHKKYNTWFARAEEPKVCTDEYEQGAYYYFELHEWCQRIRSDFRFEYCFLDGGL